jgi:phage shock protein A
MGNSKAPSQPGTARAARLRQKIDEIKARPSGADDNQGDKQESPREFVHRRMDEIANGGADDSALKESN